MQFEDKNQDVFLSHYIIDGVQMDATPAEMLVEDVPEGDYLDIIDETPEPPISSAKYDESAVSLLEGVTLKAESSPSVFNLIAPDHFTRSRIAFSLIDMLWRGGHFRLGDLSASLVWKWDCSPVGNMASFYASVGSAGAYLYDLGVVIGDYSCRGSISPAENFFECHLDLNESVGNWSPYESRHPFLTGDAACDNHCQASDGAWIIYIPFDTCQFRLGDSALSRCKGDFTTMPPQIQDPDYFIDCYEVVREMVEDSVIQAGITVGEGGLCAAAVRFAQKCGFRMDLSGIMNSYSCQSAVQILCSEVPGVLVQISEDNFDYADSQLLLQDVAYYPLGQVRDVPGVEFVQRDNASVNVADIVASLAVKK